MPHSQNLNIQEESELKRIIEQALHNYKLIIASVIITLLIAFLINRYSIPIYDISASILIKERTQQRPEGVNDYLNSSLFGVNNNLQNELWVMKSYPVMESTVRNLDLSVTYYTKGKFHYYETYQNTPFKISYLTDHPQPLDVLFNVSLRNDGTFNINAESKKAFFFNLSTGKLSHRKDKWNFSHKGKFGELIENQDLAFIVEPRDTSVTTFSENKRYGFRFKSYVSLANEYKGKFGFTIVDRMATVIKINLESESSDKGIDIVNELMDVYSRQNLERKNHTASITIDYIEKQINEISDSLNQVEDNLQTFRTSNQLLNIADQSSNISAQNADLQNQLAEMVSRKRYYDYVIDYLSKNENFSNMMLPASIGVSDQMLNTLMSELVSAQAQRSNLIENNQERNPLVPRLKIQIENLKKTIVDNITAVGKTTSISIEELNKRIRKIEAEMSRLPGTQRQLGNIERKYRLNDAIYNYMLEKRAEAKITKASNLPDDVIIEPARLVSGNPIYPNKRLNYLIALFLGIALPLGFLMTKNILNNKVESQDDVERLTNSPVLGKILHNRSKTKNVMFEYPNSNLAESFRVLRTNLDFCFRGEQKKVIMVTSCLEHEGKSFIAMNLAMSYAQLGRKTILVDFDLRKPKSYFKEGEESQEGISSYMINKTNLEEIIKKSTHGNLDYILSGILPPNPVELMALEKTKKLIAALKQNYDIIVLDTTPLAQVTDAYLLLDYSDAKILVARYNYTIKNVFSVIIKDLHTKKINDIYVVLNDNKLYRDQYGYGYGYYNKGGKKKEKIFGGVKQKV